MGFSASALDALFTPALLKVCEDSIPSGSFACLSRWHVTHLIVHVLTDHLSVFQHNFCVIHVLGVCDSSTRFSTFSLFSFFLICFSLFSSFPWNFEASFSLFVSSFFLLFSCFSFCSPLFSLSCFSLSLLFLSLAFLSLSLVSLWKTSFHNTLASGHAARWGAASMPLVLGGAGFMVSTSSERACLLVQLDGLFAHPQAPPSGGQPIGGRVGRTADDCQRRRRQRNLTGMYFLLSVRTTFIKIHFHQRPVQGDRTKHAWVPKTKKSAFL